jgi:hypothetical protein
MPASRLLPYLIRLAVYAAAILIVLVAKLPDTPPLRGTERGPGGEAQSLARWPGDKVTKLERGPGGELRLALLGILVAGLVVEIAGRRTTWR